MSERQKACERLAAHFQARPGVPIPAIDLMPIGGWCSWRTRISDLRVAPYHMDIRNSTRTARRDDGTAFKASTYVYVPAQVQEIAS